MSNLANIAIGLIVVGLLLVRQLQPRPAKETSAVRLLIRRLARGPRRIAFLGSRGGWPGLCDAAGTLPA